MWVMFGFKVHFKCLIIFIYKLWSKLSLQKMAKARPEPDPSNSESSEDDDTAPATPGIREFMSYIINPEATLTFLRSVGLILTVVMCTKCDKPMKQQKDPKSPKPNGDTLRWQCSTCKKTSGLRCGSVFYVSMQHIY